MTAEAEAVVTSTAAADASTTTGEAEAVVTSSGVAEAEVTS